MSSLKKLISETVHKVLLEMAASTIPEANTYITYGFAVDTKDNFKPLETSGFRFEVNRGSNKPIGGLWGSPIDSDFGWKEFCEREDFRTETLETYTLWKLKDNANIWVINHVESFEDLLDEYGYFEDPRYKKYLIDFNKMSKDYDGIFLTNSGNWRCRDWVKYKDGYSNLSTWDCESIVVWNPNVVEIVETHE